MSGQQKVGASLHNDRAAFSNNAPVGSNPPEPALLTGGGGSISSNSVTDLLGLPPTTIKRRASDPCYSGQPCSDLWNTHSDSKDLRRHLHYLFGVSWRAISRIFDDYGVDHVNQNIHETREYVRDQVANGKTIKSLARCFMYCMDGIRDAEPELSPEAAAERDVTVKAGLDAFKPQKKTKDDRSKYLDEYNKRSQGR
jgi:hypothetical protein